MTFAWLQISWIPFSKSLLCITDLNNNKKNPYSLLCNWTFRCLWSSIESVTTQKAIKLPRRACKNYDRHCLVGTQKCHIVQKHNGQWHIWLIHGYKNIFLSDTCKIITCPSPNGYLTYLHLVLRSGLVSY